MQAYSLKWATDVSQRISASTRQGKQLTCKRLLTEMGDRHQPTMHQRIWRETVVNHLALKWATEVSQQIPVAKSPDVRSPAKPERATDVSQQIPAAKRPNSFIWNGRQMSLPMTSSLEHSDCCPSVEPPMFSIACTCVHLF